MKTKFTAPATLFLLSLFLIINSCKDNNINELRQSPESKRTREIFPLESVAPELYEEITDRYDDYGKVVYSHFKFNPVDDPIEYMPEHLRASFTERNEKVQRENEGLTIRQRLDKLRDANLMNEHIHSLYVDFFEKVGSELEDTDSPVEFWKFLRKYEKELIARPNDEGIGNLLVFSSMMRNFVRYNWEVEEFTKRAVAEQTPFQELKGNAVESTSSSNCFFGLKKTCWYNAVAQSVIDGIADGLKTAVGTASGGVDKEFWKGVKGAGYASAAITFIKETIGAYNNSTCGCGSTVSSCATPTGLRLLIDDCTLSHYFQVMGAGTGASTFKYVTNNNAFLPEYAPGTYCCVDGTSDRTIKVTQANQNSPFRLDVTVYCFDGSKKYYSNSYDLYALTRDPGPVTLSGATNVPFGDTENYTATGTGLVANRNNTWTWSKNWAANSSFTGGQANNDYIRITWGVAITNQAKVYLNSYNACSGITAYRDLTINVY
ncbi:hypothetical protein BH24BAC1_BH24BAC1_33960 [soil metagenome]